MSLRAMMLEDLDLALDIVRGGRILTNKVRNEAEVASMER
jgi:hypothetical protein